MSSEENQVYFLCSGLRVIMQDLSEFINKTIQEWIIPGVAIAIVKDSELIFCEGFGMQDIEKNLRVTPKTLFGIGSCTKSFTAMAMGILVERGKLEWDKPVKNYLPTFKLYDSYATEHMTLRDLLAHRSGLPRHDYVWYQSPFSYKEILERLQYLEPAHELRTVFLYQNLMYIVAGYLIGEIAGSSWKEFVQEEILNPLEMSNTNFSVDESQKTDNFALPYLEKDNKLQVIPFCNLDVSAPAGSINSNVTDMAKWLILNLNRGKYGSKQIISETHLKEMHSPQFIIGQPPQYNELFYDFYGFGWMISAYRGHDLIHHGGNIDGFCARMNLLPQDNIGIVILTNLDTTLVVNSLTYYLCDRLLGLDELPWNERIKEKLAQMKAATAKAEEEIVSSRKTGTKPSHPLEDYVGYFEHPAYGIFSIEIHNNHLTAIHHSGIYELEHYHYDIFMLKSRLFDQPKLISFLTDTKGDINSLTVPLEPMLKPILFTRITQQ